MNTGAGELDAAVERGSSAAQADISLERRADCCEFYRRVRLKPTTPPLKPPDLQHRTPDAGG